MERGNLEEFIDIARDGVPETMQEFRDKDVKKFLFMENENDFVLGYSMARIFYGYTMSFVPRNNRALTEQEKAEVIDIILKRTKEIKEAIHNCG